MGDLSEPLSGLAAATGESSNGLTSSELAPQNPQSQTISADEIALYDRQIRLWGVRAQEKLRNAKILLIGMKALANEIAKNLVLAGIGSLTVVDDQPVAEDDLGAQFFISEQHIGVNRAEAALPQIQKLNPRVALHAVTTSVLLQPPEYYSAFTLVIATDLPLVSLSTINSCCRLSSRPFYAAQTFGFYGYVFADLIKHTFVIEREQSNVMTQLKPETATRRVIASTTKKENGKMIELVTKEEIYSQIVLANSSPLSQFELSSMRRKLNVTPLISCLRALWEYQSLVQTPYPTPSHANIKLFTQLATEKHKELQLPTESLRAEFLRSFLQNLGSEISPVCAFLGGQLAQDVINVVGGKGQPIQNLLLFDGDECKGPVYALHPIFAPLPGETNAGNGIASLGVGPSNGSTMT
ncbi:hypothetical protein MMC26_002314 [Xylographa opegraphella]|nr:hypothetical protein [Xylographa opegraphella]